VTRSPRLRAILTAPLLALGVLTILASESGPINPASSPRIAVHQATGTTVLALLRDAAISLNASDAIGPLAELSGETGDALALSMDGGGNASAVWADASRGVFTARFNRAATAWSAVQTLATAGPEPAYFPHAHLNAAGPGMAVWYQRTPEPNFGHLWSAPVTADGTVGTPLEIPTGGTNMTGPPKVAVDPAGNAVTVWREGVDWGDVTTPQVWAAEYRAGLIPAWTTAMTHLNASLPAAQVFDVAVGADGAGNMVAAWSQGTEVYAAHRPAGSSMWGAPWLLHTVAGGRAFGLQLAVDDIDPAAEGSAFVGWMVGRAAWAVRYDPMAALSGWEAAIHVSDLDMNSQDGPVPPSLDTNGAGGAVFAWSSQDPATIGYAIYNPATPGWTAFPQFDYGRNVSASMDGAMLGLAWSKNSGAHTTRVTP